MGAFGGFIKGMPKGKEKIWKKAQKQLGIQLDSAASRNYQKGKKTGNETIWSRTLT